MRKALFLLIAALAPAQAFAANQVALDNNVFVERVTTDAASSPRAVSDRILRCIGYLMQGALSLSA